MVSFQSSKILLRILEMKRVLMLSPRVGIDFQGTELRVVCLAKDLSKFLRRQAFTTSKCTSTF